MNATVTTRERMSGQMERISQCEVNIIIFMFYLSSSKSTPMFPYMRVTKKKGPFSVIHNCKQQHKAFYMSVTRVPELGNQTQGFRESLLNVYYIRDIT